MSTPAVAATSSKARTPLRNQHGLNDETYFRQLYDKPPDFKQLARLDPDFAAVVNGRELDFDDPKSVMQLTKTLLKLDFGLDIELPENRLCPPVPNRHNYILWLKDLVDTTSYDAPGRKAVGLDIGTGASCIYPLLGCAQRPWSFIATDIDEESLTWARRNITSNGLESRIHLRKTENAGPLIPLDSLDIDTLDFTMTNPPFYESQEALASSAAKKNLAPATACTGAPVEMVTSGGEVGFATRILTESLCLRERVQWYSSMFGFLSSVTTFVDLLKSEDIDNYALTEFVQGSRTRRWAVAWSFQSMRPSQDTARGTKATTVPKAMLPPITEADMVHFALIPNISDFTFGFYTVVSALELLDWNWDKQTLVGSGRASDKVWSRAWRRRKKRELAGHIDDESKSKTEDLFGFSISILVQLENIVVRCRWVQGHDALAYESFRGYLKDTAKTSYTEAQANRK